MLFVFVFLLRYKYLGSTVIKELRGTESTKKSIQKLKKNEKIPGVNAINSSGETTTTIGLANSTHQNTRRAVNILISYRGVQFIDPEMQVNKMLCVYSNIWTQDAFIDYSYRFLFHNDL